MTQSTAQCPFNRLRRAVTSRTATRGGRRAPGPCGFPGIGSLPAMKRDVLGLMLRGMREHGDVVRYKVGPMTAHLVCHPDDIAHVFAHPELYDKQTFASAKIRKITGDGLLVTNGERWAEQRRAIQPAFSAARVARFLNLVVHNTDRMLDRWADAARAGTPIDVASQMMRLTYNIVEQALFSTDPTAEADESVGDIEQAITVAMAHAYREVENPLSLSAFLPTPANRRFRRAMRVLEQRVDRIIEAHRHGDGHDDLLTGLMRAGDSGKCPHLDDRSLRSQTITMLLAGHETTANALTWLWHCLDRCPDVADRVGEEAQRVLDAGPMTHDQLDSLTYTAMSVREAMRLHTPIWAIVRRVVDDDVIRGYRIPRGTKLVISPYVTHRHAEFWPDAERFDPQRFEPGRIRAMHPCAYIPFGGGPRFCVGQSLARLEAVVIAARVARRYRLRLVPGHPVEADPGITLRSRHGLKMTLESRSLGS
ncbi:MAG: cytochrome P450 [Phycisphaeraceae bacterium]